MAITFHAVEAALGVEQTRRGLAMIKTIAAQGIGVVIITHIMAQAFQVADRLVVIRHGRVAGNIERAATSPDEIVRMITGEGVVGQSPPVGAISERKIRER